MTSVPQCRPRRKRGGWESIRPEYHRLIDELVKRKVTIYPYADDKSICEPASATRLGVAPYELGFLVDDHDGGSPQPVAELLEMAHAHWDAWPSATPGHLHRWIYAGRGVPSGLWRESYWLAGSYGELRFLAPTIVYDPERLLALISTTPRQADLTELMAHFEVDERELPDEGYQLRKGSRDTLVELAFKTALRNGDMDEVRAMAARAGIKLHSVETTIAGAEAGVKALLQRAQAHVAGLPVHSRQASAVLKKRALLAAIFCYQNGADGESYASIRTLRETAAHYETMCQRSAEGHISKMAKEGLIQHGGYCYMGHVDGAFERYTARLKIVELAD